MGDVVVTLSGFLMTEKKSIEFLVNLLGATYSPLLQVPPTTHLICKTPVGKKYEKAKSTPEIRIVNLNWLEVCAVKGFRPEESKFPVIFPSDDVQPLLNPMENQNTNISNLQSQSKVAPENDGSKIEKDPEADMMDVEQADVGVANDPNSRVTAGALEMRDDNSDNGEKRSSQLNNGTPNAPVERNPQPQAIANPNAVLAGVVIYVSRTIANQEQNLMNITTNLGGSFRWVFDEFVTHFIHQGQVKNNKQLKQALSSPTVASSFLFRCSFSCVILIRAGSRRVSAVVARL